MTLAGWKPIALLMVAAVALRLWGTFEDETFVYDESTIVPATRDLLASGTSAEWRHPPVHGLLQAGAMLALGDGPVAWRLGDALFSCAVVFLTWLLARRLGGSPAAALLAAAFLAFDPFHLYFSRTPMIEAPVVAFFLVFAVLVVEFAERGRPTLPLAGLALGLVVATKAYYVLSIPLLAGWAAWRALRRPGADRRAALVDLAACLAVLPATVVLLANAGFFARGFGLGDLLAQRLDAWWSSTHDLTFGHSFFLALGGKPWQWFLRPAGFGFTLWDDGELARYSLEIHSPLFRWLVLPSVAWLGVRAWRRRSAVDAVAPALFASGYLLFFVGGRPFNSYSALAIYPFGAVAAGEAVAALGRRLGREEPLALAAVAVLGLVAVWLFPLVAGLVVPKDAYALILPYMNLTGGR